MFAMMVSIDLIFHRHINYLKPMGSSLVPIKSNLVDTPRILFIIKLMAYPNAFMTITSPSLMISYAELRA